MTLGSCALRLDGYKSQLYGGPWWGRWDLRAPSFPFPHLDHSGIFRGGDKSGAGGERGSNLSVSATDSSRNWAMHPALADDAKVEVGPVLGRYTKAELTGTEIMTNHRHAVSAGIYQILSFLIDGL